MDPLCRQPGIAVALDGSRNARPARMLFAALGRISAVLLLLLGLPTTGCTLNQIQQKAAVDHIAQGDSALAAEDLDRALSEFNEAIRLNPTLATAFSRVGDVHRKKGRHDVAVSYYSEAIRLDPADYDTAIRLGESNQILAATVVDKVERLEAAVRAYLHACSLKPNSPEAYLNLGICSYQLGRLDSAVDYCQKCIACNPKLTAAHINLGAAYEAQQKYYEAIRSYKNALECDARQALVHVNLGTIYLKQGRFPAATNSFELALKLNPDLAIAHERLGYCRYRQQRYDEALQSYDRALTLDPKQGEALAGRGVVRMTIYLRHPERGEFRDRAIEDWHSSLELIPNQPKLRELIAKYAPAVNEPVAVNEISEPVR